MIEGARMAWWHGGGMQYGREETRGGEERGDERFKWKESGITLSRALRESSEDTDVMISFSTTEVARGLSTVVNLSTEARAETNEE